MTLQEINCPRFGLIRRIMVRASSYQMQGCDFFCLSHLEQYLSVTCDAGVTCNCRVEIWINKSILKLAFAIRFKLQQEAHLRRWNLGWQSKPWQLFWPKLPNFHGFRGKCVGLIFRQIPGFWIVKDNVVCRKDNTCECQREDQ